MDLQSSPCLSHGRRLGEDDRGRKKILDALMLEVSNKPLTHEVLVTFMAEVYASFHHVNARPLVPVSTDPENPQILSPAMLLTQKITGIVHLDNIDEKILYHIQWKKVQALADIFWKRRVPEHASRNRKCTTQQKNIQVGDVVLRKKRASPKLLVASSRHPC